MDTSTQRMPKKVPPQHQDKQPGIEEKMTPQPIYDNDEPGYGRLKDMVALITGGDSGIGRAVAITFAKEGADVAIVYLNEHDDARATKERIEKIGRRCITLAGDVGDPGFCDDAISVTVDEFGKLDIL